MSGSLHRLRHKCLCAIAYRSIWTTLAALCLCLGSALARPGGNNVTYAAPETSDIGSAQLQNYYAWREKMDWLLAPIHSRADLAGYLKATATSGSPLDVLPPAARQRFLASVRFGPHGAGTFNFSELQYLSTPQVYRILSLFGLQGEALTVTNGRIRTDSFEPAAGAEASARMQERFDEYSTVIRKSIGEAWDKQSGLVASAYVQTFASEQDPEHLQRATNGSLRLLFRAACLAASYTTDAKYARDAQMDFEEMDKRGFAAEPDESNMYEALIDTRQFAEAREFYRNHGDAGLTPLPTYRDDVHHAGAHTPTVLVVDTDKHELVRRTITLDAPAQVVVLTDPDCHFCRDFDAALASRPALREVLDRYAIWLTLPGSELEFDTLQRWDKAHPAEHVNILFSFDDWPLPRIMGTPVFFFLSRGKLVARHVGWRGPADLSEIEADLRKIGLVH